MGVFCVANAADDTISVLCSESFEILDTLSLPKGSGPRRLCSCNGLLFCANSFSDTVTVIGDGTDLVPVGKYPTGIACNGEQVYITCGDTNDIWALDKTGKPKFYAPAGVFPNSLFFKDDILVCASMLSNEVRFFDKTLQLQKCVEVKEHPVFAAFCSSKELLFVCHAGDSGKNGSFGIYTFKKELLRQFPTETMPTTIAVSQNEHKVYICCTDNDSILVLDYDSLAITEKRIVGRMPDDLIIDEKTGIQIVSCMLEDCVKVFNREGELLHTVHSGREPRGLCYCDNFSIKKR